MLHWYEENGCLQRTISITIRSIISHRLLEDMLRYNSSDLLRAMYLIENARTLREKGANDCLTNLNRVIDMPHKVDVNKSDHGPSYFMRGQALCLRALCRYEEHDSSPQAFIQDSKAALRMWSENDFVDNNERILQYTTKLLLFVFDVLITIHNNDSHQFLEKILDFFKKSDSKVVKMLWQFKSHHSHLSSERFHNILGGGGIQFSRGDVKFSINDGKSIEDLEGIVSDISEEISWSLESGCLLAQICYDLGERMLMMGHMNEEATILELMGDGTEALKILKKEKTLSLQRGSSFLVGRFHVAIGKIHRKSQDFELAKEELKKANIQLNRITCGRCKLLLQVEIGKESTKHMRMGVCSPDIKYNSAFAEDRLENDLKNGCKCWEHSCGFSLLSSLTEKGKDYIFKDDTRQVKSSFLMEVT